MLNNIDDDYITSIAIGLFIGLFEDNCINKKFRNMENEGGILNGEFIKNHLKRETELEEKANIMLKINNEYIYAKVMAVEEDGYRIRFTSGNEIIS